MFVCYLQAVAPSSRRRVSLVSFLSRSLGSRGPKLIIISAISRGGGSSPMRAARGAIFRNRAGCQVALWQLVSQRRMWAASNWPPLKKRASRRSIGARFVVARKRASALDINLDQTFSPGPAAQVRPVWRRRFAARREMELLIVRSTRRARRTKFARAELWLSEHRSRRACPLVATLRAVAAGLSGRHSAARPTACVAGAR